jgi:hypothetical protein
MPLGRKRRCAPIGEVTGFPAGRASMKKAALAAVAAASLAAWLPSSGAAQTLSPSTQYGAIAESGITAQLSQLSARIDRYLAHGQLSQAEAVDAHRDVNAIEDQANAYREDNGGKLSDTERIEMQKDIDNLNADIRRERDAHGTAPAN